VNVRISLKEQDMIGEMLHLLARYNPFFFHKSCHRATKMLSVLEKIISWSFQGQKLQCRHNMCIFTIVPEKPEEAEENITFYSLIY